MSVSNLATALSVLFAVFLVALAGELIYVLWRHRSFRRRSSPIRRTHHETTPPNSSSFTDIHDAATATKELQLYFFFFCLKPDHTVPPRPPNYKDDDDEKDDDESSPDDHVVDVFKLLDNVKDKEEDKDEGESKKPPDVDFSNYKSTTKTSSSEVVVAVMSTVDYGLEEDGDTTKTVFSTPCDSPMFFTPVGSPSRD